MSADCTHERILTLENTRDLSRASIDSFPPRADPGTALTGAAASPPSRVPVPRYPLPGPRYLLSVTGGTGTAARLAAARLAQAYSRPLEVTQMQDGRFPFEMVDGVPVVAAPEEIDITNAPELRSALLEAAAHGHGTVVADLSRTQFCDSSGLHTLLAAHKRATAAGGDMLLVIPGNYVLRVFTITGVDHIIPNFASLEEALAQTSASGPNGSFGSFGSNGSNGSNGHRRADGGPERQPSASGADEGAS